MILVNSMFVLYSCFCECRFFLVIGMCCCRTVVCINFNYRQSTIDSLKSMGFSTFTILTLLIEIYTIVFSSSYPSYRFPKDYSVQGVRNVLWCIVYKKFLMENMRNHRILLQVQAVYIFQMCIVRTHQQSRILLRYYGCIRQALAQRAKHNGDLINNNWSH